jgi:hypothetical protein
MSTSTDAHPTPNKVNAINVGQGINLSTRFATIVMLILWHKIAKDSLLDALQVISHLKEDVFTMIPIVLPTIP